MVRKSLILSKRIVFVEELIRLGVQNVTPTRNPRTFEGEIKTNAVYERLEQAGFVVAELIPLRTPQENNM